MSNLIIILDLDNTLVHSLHSVEDKEQINKIKESGYKQSFCKGGYHIYERPYLHDFLDYIYHLGAEVVVWSVGTQAYVEPIVHEIFKRYKKNKAKNIDAYFPSKIISRENYGGKIEKDIKRLIGDDEYLFRTTCPIKDGKIDEECFLRQVLFIDDIPERIKNLPVDAIIKVDPFQADENINDELFKRYREHLIQYE